MVKTTMVKSMNRSTNDAIPDLNWQLRSLLAATGVAFCLFLAAFSAAASSRDLQASRAADAQIAEEAEMMASLAEHLAAATAEQRDRLDAPRLKPAAPVARTVSRTLAAGGRVDGLAEWDLAEAAVIRAAAREQTCLAEAIYYEARSESRIGRMAVADVVLNRVSSSLYPNTICGVVFQGSERTTGCQFSFTCDGSMKRPRNERLWRESEAISGAVMSGMRLPITRQATHYHANYVDPYWAASLTPTAVIGTHKFYRFPSKSLRTAAPAAM